MKHAKSKARRGLVTRRIVYMNHQSPHARHQELKVDVRSGTVIDMEYAAALVAVRTPLSLADIKILRVEPEILGRARNREFERDWGVRRERDLR
ncbi:MAG: hypothetical protein ACRDRU_00375 [Pseudonocardiaceae bacterium]